MAASAPDNGWSADELARMNAPGRGALSENDGRLFMAILDMCHFLVDQITGEHNFADVSAAGELRANPATLHLAAALTGKMYSYWDAAPAGPGVYSMLKDWTKQQAAQDGVSLAKRELGVGRGKGPGGKSGFGAALHAVAMNEVALWPRQRVSSDFFFAGETEAGEAILVDGARKKAYAVTGISTSLGNLLRANGRSPIGATLRLTLLPFMGKIVYDAHLLGAPPPSDAVAAEARACADAAVASGALVRELPKPPPLLGLRVRISGLQSRPELNGTHGTAFSFSEEKGRYAVRVEGSREELLLKPACLAEAAPLVSQAPAVGGGGGAPLDAFEQGVRTRLAALPALRKEAGMWTVRRMAYTEAENPQHEACIIAGNGQMVPAGGDYPMLRFARLAPTAAEYLRGLLAAVGANGNKKPHMLAVDEQSAVARLQEVLGPAGIEAGYYPPPSDEELTTMGVM